jgi:transcriptional regulator with XRE-family HTH domain
VLLRRLLGDVLRRHRVRQSRTLRDVSAVAGVSLGYLSEVERGRKEASSELLAAICSALDISLSDVLREAGDDLAREERRRRLVPVGFGRAVSPYPTRPALPHASASRPAAPRPAATRPPSRAVAGIPPLSTSVSASTSASALPETGRARPATPVASVQASVVAA